MSANNLGDREFLQSLFLSTGDSNVLAMLERSERRTFGGALRALKNKLIAIAPFVIIGYAVIAYR